MIRNIIFDIGDVLLHFDTQEFVRGRVGSREEADAVHRLVFLDPRWLDLDRGIITEEDFRSQLIAENPGYVLQLERVLENWYDIFEPMERNIQILRKLKAKGYALYYLSNFHHRAFEYVFEKFGFFSAFRGGVVSYQIHLLKPEREIYKALMKKYRLKAKESVFIDDTMKNVEAAKSCSITGICYHPAMDLKQELDNILVEP